MRLALLALLAGCAVDDVVPIGVEYTCTTTAGGVLHDVIELCSSPWDIEAEQDAIYVACHRGCDVSCVPDYVPCGR